jgi:hypothetical protein
MWPRQAVDPPPSSRSAVMPLRRCAAAHACDLSADLARRAARRAEAAPKLRATGAKAALRAARRGFARRRDPIAGLSERGARRLFERLAALGAIREPTGRATFRLYGL